MSKRSYEEIFKERNPRPYKGDVHHVDAYRESSGMRFGYDTEWYTEEEYKATMEPKTPVFHYTHSERVVF